MFRHFTDSLCELYLENCFSFKFLSWSRNPQHFVAHKGSLLCSEEAATTICPKADESSLHPPIHEAINKLRINDYQVNENKYTYHV